MRFNGRYNRFSYLGRLGPVVFLAQSLYVTVDVHAKWPQWGGPNGNFIVDAVGLADEWPAEGPKQVWQRSLGVGHSAIVADADKIYTMYRQGDDEIVVALWADTGGTVWEHRYLAKPYRKQTVDFSQGPNATPLLLDDKIITIGFTGVMHCVAAESGKPIWSHDLVKDFKSKVQYYGYSNSPIAYKDTIITLVGGKDHGVIALNPDTGETAWKSRQFDIGYASPILINVDGQDQFVFFSPTKVIGLNPRDGSYLWSHKVINFCRTNCTSAIWGDDNLLWAATKGVGGARGLKLVQHNGKTEVEQVWVNRKARLYHWNAIRVGDHIYASIGDSKTFLSIIEAKTGEIVERLRGFAAANVIYADGKMILLDHAGKLALAKISPENIEIVSSVQLLASPSWTVPTLVGKTLFIRDRRNIIALDLG
ncbi:MAG: PQQ-binding-like beta-propeller repeat protein [Phycisphaerales bacterium]|nr:MAG: PQQ-binding-like beta-propeller repeat protein [Phycisphaerales bacterium]